MSIRLGAVESMILQLSMTHIKKNPSRAPAGVLELKLDDDLLSHGDTPHYHRR